jgi:hypothetical protein
MRRLLERVSIRVTTDIPGRSRSAKPSASSMAILTAIRRTTFVKFPVALALGGGWRRTAAVADP